MLNHILLIECILYWYNGGTPGAMFIVVEKWIWLPKFKSWMDPNIPGKSMNPIILSPTMADSWVDWAL